MVRGSLQYGLGACLVLTLAGAACSEEPGVTPSNQSVMVNIQNVQFAPAEITVQAGTQVRWVNLDPLDHDVTSGVSIVGRQARGVNKTKLPDGNFRSALFSTNKTFSFTFSAAGEYPYYCDLHPFMIGKVIVK